MSSLALAAAPETAPGGDSSSLGSSSKLTHYLLSEGVAVIDVHGVGNLAEWWRLFSAYGIPAYVVFDIEAKDDKAGVKRLGLPGSPGVPGARHAGCMATTDRVVESGFSVFGEDVERTMRAEFRPEYEALEARARSIHGIGKTRSRFLHATWPPSCRGSIFKCARAL